MENSQANDEIGCEEVYTDDDQAKQDFWSTEANQIWDVLTNNTPDD